MYSQLLGPGGHNDGLYCSIYCIVPNRNLQGLPKHLNGHPKVSEQNLLPQNMVSCTREASRAPGDPTLEGPRTRPHQDCPARTRPRQTPHHRGEGGFPPTRPHTTGGGRGRGIPTHQTPHHRRRRRRREGDSQRPDPTPQAKKEGRREGDYQSTGGARSA